MTTADAGFQSGFDGTQAGINGRRQKRTPAGTPGNPGKEIPTMKQAMDEHSDCYRCAILAESRRQHISGIN